MRSATELHGEPIIGSKDRVNVSPTLGRDGKHGMYTPPAP